MRALRGAGKSARQLQTPKLARGEREDLDRGKAAGEVCTHSLIDGPGSSEALSFRMARLRRLAFSCPAINAIFNEMKKRGPSEVHRVFATRGEALP